MTTNAEPQVVINLFKRVIPTGIKHGTVTILMGNHAFEITTYRIDGKYSDGRRPDNIQFTPSIEEDLLRRDFTINSIAYNIKNGSILDINQGIDDLNHRIIRAIGNPAKRFDEDALRLVRACRFASQLNFTIEKETYLSMSMTLSKLDVVSKERISEELIKILTSDHPSIAFNHFYYCGMLKILFPEIYSAASDNIESFVNALKDLDTIDGKKAYIRFARLISITKQSDHYKILKDLKLSNNFIKSTIHILNFINQDLNLLDTPYKLRKFISNVGIENIEDLRNLWIGMANIDRNIINNKIQLIFEELEKNIPLSIKDLKITGNDLVTELGINPGPKLGEILNKLLIKALENPQINNKEKLLKYAKEMNL